MKPPDPLEGARTVANRKYLRNLPSPLDASKEGPDAVARLWVESVLTDTPPGKLKATSRLWTSARFGGVSLWNNPLFGVEMSVASGPETTLFLETLEEYRRVWRETKRGREPLLRLWFFIVRDAGYRYGSLGPPRYRSAGYYRALRRFLTHRGIDAVEILEGECLRLEAHVSSRRRARPEVAFTSVELHQVRTVLMYAAAVRSLQHSKNDPYKTRFRKAFEAIYAEAAAFGWEKLGVRMSVAHILDSDLSHLIDLIARDKKRHPRVNPIRVAIEECNRTGLKVPTKLAEWRALQKRFREQSRRRTKPPSKI